MVHITWSAITRNTEPLENVFKNNLDGKNWQHLQDSTCSEISCYSKRGILRIYIACILSEDVPNLSAYTCTYTHIHTQTLTITKTQESWLIGI